MIFTGRDFSYDLGRRALVMAILNVTPDSFSEEGANFERDKAIAAGLAMAEAGADIIDVGGESTRPGAEPVDADEEARRVAPVIRALRQRLELPISIDTSKAAVARTAIDAGANIINDISGFRRDPEMPELARATGAGAIVMHMRGTPQTMQQFTDYDNLVGELNAYFEASMALLAAAGVAPEAVALDPGIGFSKTVEQNLQLVNELDRFAVHGRPILLGPSRKSFIGKTLRIDNARDRVWGTAAAVTLGLARGARIVRVHDVAEMRQVCDLTMAMLLSDGEGRA